MANLMGQFGFSSTFCIYGTNNLKSAVQVEKGEEFLHNVWSQFTKHVAKAYVHNYAITLKLNTS